MDWLDARRERLGLEFESEFFSAVQVALSRPDSFPVDQTGYATNIDGELCIRRTMINASPSCLTRVLVLFVGIVVLVFLTLNLYRPDSPLSKISPGTSSEPTFVVQVIRPREGLPLGGLLPPQLFGVDAQLGFDSASEGAMYSVGQERIELSADGWELKLVFDSDGRVTAETEIVFELIFQDRDRKVRCRPATRPSAH